MTPAEERVIAAARTLNDRQPLMRGGYELIGGELRAYLALLAAVKILETERGRA